MANRYFIFRTSIVRFYLRIDHNKCVNRFVAILIAGLALIEKLFEGGVSCAGSKFPLVPQLSSTKESITTTMTTTSSPLATECQVIEAGGFGTVCSTKVCSIHSRR